MEVGTTESHTTLKHLFRHQAVARWPYGSEYIYIIYNPTPGSSVIEKYLNRTEQIEEEVVVEERSVVEKTAIYRGKADIEVMTHLFQVINETVEKYNLPTNLYTESSSQIDLSILDFRRIDLSETMFDTLCVATLRNQYDGKTSHLVIRPNTKITVTVDVRVTDEAPVYQYLAIRLEVQEV